MRRLIPFLMMVATSVMGAVPASAQDVVSDAFSGFSSSIRTNQRLVDFNGGRLTPAGAIGELSPRNAEGAYYFVRDLIEYDIYSGKVRGDRGTLFTRAGNSLDRSLLLGALLDELRVDWRLAHGTLTDEQATRLVALATRGGSYTGNLIPEDAVVFDASSDIRHRNIARDHFWVQASISGDWLDLDTSDPAVEMGSSLTEAQSTFGVGALPDADVQITNLGLYYTTSGTNGGQVLAIESPTADLAFRNINISLIRLADGSFVPRATVGTDVIDGTPLYAGGLDRVWIEVFFRQGGLETRVVRDLYSADSSVDMFNVDQAVYSFLLLPGFVGPDYFRAVVSTVWAGFNDDAAGLQRVLQEESGNTVFGTVASDRLANQIADTLGSVLGMSALTFAHLSDELTLRTALMLGVRPFYDRPRVLIAGAIRSGDDLYFSMDLRDNSIDALPYDHVPWAATYALQALRGRVDSELEGRLMEAMTGQPVLDTAEFMAQARADGASLRTIHQGNVTRLRGSSYSPEAQRRLTAEITSNGFLALAPSGPVNIGGQDLTFWWRIEPSNGAMLGVSESGLNPGFPNLTGVAEPDPSGADEASFLVSELLGVIQSAIDTSFNVARDVDSYESLVCNARCELMDTTYAICGGGRPPFDVVLESCMVRQASLSSSLLIGQNVTCASQVENFMCGVEVFDAVSSRLITLQSSGGGYLGPWSELSPLYMGNCSCAPR
jgi:hypothetical protein